MTTTMPVQTWPQAILTPCEQYLQLSEAAEPRELCLGDADVPDPIGLPLSHFDNEIHKSVYGSPSLLDSETDVPKPPAGFADPYLYPVLAQNELTRLNLFWYYTKGLDQDKEMLTKLDEMLDLVKQSIGWDVGLVGLLDATTYTRIVAANITTATIPRRESTCSHIINQAPGTVLMVTDLSQDWRFKYSPAVVGGLRSYAGAQIRLSLPSGDQVIFGSLCIASMKVQHALNDDQKKTLVRTADLMMSELVTRTRLRRMNDRQQMMEDLAMLKGLAPTSNIENEVQAVLKKHYPGSTVFTTQNHVETVQVDRERSIPVGEFVNGLWTDAQSIEAQALAMTTQTTHSGGIVRAVLGRIMVDGRFLTVTTPQVRCVFDEIDVWFVDQCCQVISAAVQSYAIREALAAKERFLRSITHELRTPIHGILSSVELLNGELESNAALASTSFIQTLLATIRRSGTELMTTVNSILRLNSFSNGLQSTCAYDYDLDCLESDVLSEVLANYPEDELHGLAIHFENKLNHCLVRVDADLLKELLKCLVFNSIAATSMGTIKVSFEVGADESLVFDVIDSGAGIAAHDHERVFHAFEKLNIHSKGAGLGLNLAKQMAGMLQGSLSLIASDLGKGSHFRVTLPCQFASVPAKSVQKQISRDGSLQLPYSYYVMKTSETDMYLLDHLETHLAQCGLQKSDDPEGCLIITNRPAPMQQFASDRLQHLSRSHQILVVSSSNITANTKTCLIDELKPHQVFPITGPFFTSRLRDQLTEIASRINDFPPIPSTLPGEPVMNGNSVEVSDESDISCKNSEISSASDGSTILIPHPEATPRLRALLVDDNIVNLKVLQLFCRKHKLPFESAVNGRQAFDTYCDGISKSAPTTLILLDLQMPECDGIEACRLIRQYEKQHDIRPSIIFMITGQDSVTDRKNSFDAGVDDFFVKPVSLKKLDLAISQHFPRPVL